MENNKTTLMKTPLLKKWWFWVIIAIILGAVLFVPYISVSAECSPCVEDQYCPPCPVYHYGLAGYIVDIIW
ncbi:MAG: hypothetical protein Q8P20_01710 [bacterium]|nr:hypothetical protein [bacterium]